MAAGGGDLQGPAGMGLAPDVRQIQGFGPNGCRRLQAGTGMTRVRQQLHHLAQALGGPDGQPFHQRRLCPIGGRQHQGSGAAAAGGQGHRHRSPHWPQLAIKAQLPGTPDA